MTSSDDGLPPSRPEADAADARRAAEIAPEWLRNAEHEPLTGRVPFLHAYYHELVALRPRAFASWRPDPAVRASICGPHGAIGVGPTLYRDAMRAVDAAEASAGARRAEVTGTEWRAGDEHEKTLRQTGRDAHLAGELRALFAEAGARLRGGEGAEPLSAICFSGGGIRSATFNLGVLQALARAGTLPRFDYLTSVSGGGYVAGWYHAWARRARRNHDAAGPAQALADPRAAAGEAFHPLAPEPRPLERLREFSNYLTPRRGLLSADTWAAAALVTRNLLLNWLVFLPVLAAVVGIPQLAYLVALLPPSEARPASSSAPVR